MKRNLLCILMCVACGKSQETAPTSSTSSNSKPAVRGADPTPAVKTNPTPIAEEAGAWGDDVEEAPAEGPRQPAEALRQAPPEAPQAAGACETAVARGFALARASSHPLIRADAEKANPDERVAKCKQESWPESWTTCATNAADEAAWAECDRAMFAGSPDLTPRRVIDMHQDQSGLSPPAGFGDNDLLMFDNEMQCGMLMARSGPATGVFVHCGGKITAGPYITLEEIEGVNAELKAGIEARYQTRMDMSRFSYELGRRIRANWPGGQRVRVYQNGTYIGEEYR